MVPYASTLQELRHFVAMGLKPFRPKGLSDLLNAELEPIKAVDQALDTIKKADMNLADFTDWFNRQKTALSDAFGKLAEAVGVLTPEQLEAASKTKPARAAVQLAYVSWDGEKLPTETVAFDFITNKLVECLVAKTPLTDAVPAWVAGRSDEEGTTAILRVIGTKVREIEKGIRYRAERADAGEPKAPKKSKGK